MAERLFSFFSIKKGERTRTLLMFMYFFIIIACYWFLKPVRSTLTVEKLGADSIRELKLITALLSAGVVICYSLVVNRLSREKLTYLVLGSFFWLLTFFVFSFQYFSGSRFLYYCFYIFLDLFITVNVTVFWSFMADINSLDSARRLYGIIGSGGIIGGFFGSFFCNRMVSLTGPSTMMLMVLGAYSLVFLLVFGISRRMNAQGHRDVDPVVPAGQSKLSDALAGARQVLRSPYFLMVCVLLSCYEFISTMNDFTFHKSVELAFADATASHRSILLTLTDWLGSVTGVPLSSILSASGDLEIGQGSLSSFFSEFFLLMNVIAVLAQIILTPFLLRHMTLALFFLPAIILCFSTGFFFWPVLTAVELLFLSDNAFNYSVNQTSREMLFVPVERIDKYKSLAFIDMFVLRSAKALAGFLLVLLPFLIDVRTLPDLKKYMLITISIALVWLLVAAGVGARYKQHADKKS